MTQQEKLELTVLIREQLGKHRCRFDEAEAGVLHEAAKRMTADDFIAVAWLAGHMRTAANSAGAWVAKLVLAGMLAALALGVAAVLWGIGRGYLAPPAP